MISSVFFYGVLVLLGFVLPVLAFLLVLAIVHAARGAWTRNRAYLASLLAPYFAHPRILALRRRHPRVMTFVLRRFDPNRPTGLRLTIAAIVVLLGLLFFLSILSGVVGGSALVTADVRIHNTVRLFHSLGATGFFSFVTNAGSSIVLTVLSAGVAAILFFGRYRREAVGMLLAFGGSAALSVGLKLLVQRDRPLDALVHEQSYSFPSGHTLIGAAVYGYLAYLLVRTAKYKFGDALGAAFFSALVFLIGLSRIYLGAHWPSDVLGSIGVATAWLTVVIFLIHSGFVARLVSAPVALSRRTPFTAAAFFALVFALFLVTFDVLHPQERRPLNEPAPAPIALEALVAAYPPGLPRTSEDLVGTEMAPVSLVLIGTDEDVADAFARAGWTLADPPSFRGIGVELLAIIRDHPDPHGPATPAFVGDVPQNATYQKPEGGGSVRVRHHTRLWKTARCIDPGCTPVWVATASFDDGVRFSRRFLTITHSIDPNIDGERDLIVRDLAAAGAKRLATVPVVTPTLGANAAGDPFFTDGEAVVLDLRT